LAATGQSKIFLVNWATGELVCCLEGEDGHKNTVTYVQFDHEKVISSSFDKTIKIWDFRPTLNTIDCAATKF